MKFYDLLDLGVYKDPESIGQLRFAMRLAVGEQRAGDSFGL
jgi:hypothetical protein